MGDHENWEKSRKLWRPVIHYNLVRAVNQVAQALRDAIAKPAETVSSERSLPTTFSSTSSWNAPGRPSTDSYASSLKPPEPDLTTRHGALKYELAPLQQIEQDLQELLTKQITDDGWVPSDAVMVATPFVDIPAWNVDALKQRSKELSVRSHEEWMGEVNKHFTAAEAGASNVLSVTANILRYQRQAIKELWKDPLIRVVLKRRAVKLDSAAE